MGTVEGLFAIFSVAMAEDFEDLQELSGERKLGGSEVKVRHHLPIWDVWMERDSAQAAWCADSPISSINFMNMLSSGCAYVFISLPRLYKSSHSSGTNTQLVKFPPPPPPGCQADVFHEFTQCP